MKTKKERKAVKVKIDDTNIASVAGAVSDAFSIDAMLGQLRDDAAGIQERFRNIESWLEEVWELNRRGDCPVCRRDIPYDQLNSELTSIRSKLENILPGLERLHKPCYLDEIPF